MSMIYERPVGFDSVGRLEAEPDKGSTGSYLLEHVSVEAFTNSKDEPGNYLIEVKTTLPENLSERERVASKLGITIRDDAMPFVPSQFSDPLMPRIGFELRNCLLLSPRAAGEPSHDSIRQAFGISTEWWRKDREHGLQVRLSVGMSAISQGLDRLGIDNLQAYETPQTQYETEELVRAVEDGRMLVCKRPDATTDVDAATALLWPLHDNVFHLYSNVLLQTPEFTDFVKTHGASTLPGHLDGHLAAAGSELNRMSAWDWYDFTATTQAPYRRFRHFLNGFIKPESEGSLRLAEELDALEKIDQLCQKVELTSVEETVLHDSCELVDRKGNMLDQLDPVVSSIIARFVKLQPLKM